jgi:hypothetical protein
MANSVKRAPVSNAKAAKAAQVAIDLHNTAIAAEAVRAAELSSNVAALVGAWNGGAEAIKAAEAALGAAQHGQLSMLANAVKKAGVAITAEIWGAAYAEPVKAALIASGRYTKESAFSVLSKFKRAVVYLSNGIAPEAGESVYAFITRAGATSEGAALIPAGKGSGGGRKAGDKAAAAKGTKTAGKKASTAPTAAAPAAGDRKAAAEILSAGMPKDVTALLLGCCKAEYGEALEKTLRLFLSAQLEK